MNNHKSKRKKIKCVVAFTGTKTHNGRKVFINRAILPYQDDITPETMSQRLEVWLEKIYGEIKTKVVIGDGANWITSVAKHLQATRHIDQFHFKKWVKDLVGEKLRLTETKLMCLVQ